MKIKSNTVRIAVHSWYLSFGIKNFSYNYLVPERDVSDLKNVAVFSLTIAQCKNLAWCSISATEKRIRSNLVGITR